MDDIDYCFVCNDELDECRKKLCGLHSQHSNTQIITLIKSILRDVHTERDVDATVNAICIDCLERLENWDWHKITSRRCEQELLELMVYTEKKSTMRKTIRPQNVPTTESSSTQLIPFESIKVECDETEYIENPDNLVDEDSSNYDRFQALPTTDYPRKRGRPRIHPVKQQSENKRRGRPRIHPVKPPGTITSQTHPFKHQIVLGGQKKRGRPPKNPIMLNHTSIGANNNPQLSSDSIASTSKQQQAAFSAAEQISRMHSAPVPIVRILHGKHGQPRIVPIEPKSQHSGCGRPPQHGRSWPMVILPQLSMNAPTANRNSEQPSSISAALGNPSNVTQAKLHSRTIPFATINGVRKKPGRPRIHPIIPKNRQNIPLIKPEAVYKGPGRPPTNHSELKHISSNNMPQLSSISISDPLANTMNEQLYLLPMPPVAVPFGQINEMKKRPGRPRIRPIKPKSEHKRPGRPRKYAVTSPRTANYRPQIRLAHQQHVLDVPKKRGRPPKNPIEFRREFDRSYDNLLVPLAPKPMDDSMTDMSQQQPSQSPLRSESASNATEPTLHSLAVPIALTNAIMRKPGRPRIHPISHKSTFGVVKKRGRPCIRPIIGKPTIGGVRKRGRPRIFHPIKTEPDVGHAEAQPQLNNISRIVEQSSQPTIPFVTFISGEKKQRGRPRIHPMKPKNVHGKRGRPRKTPFNANLPPLVKKKRGRPPKHSQSSNMPSVSEIEPCVVDIKEEPMDVPEGDDTYVPEHGLFWMD